MKTSFRHAVLPWVAVLAMVPVCALAETAPKLEALYETTLDIDKDGKKDRAVLVLVGPGRTDFDPLTKERYGLSEGESVDLDLYLGTGHGKLDLSSKPAFLKKNLIDPERTPWVLSLEKNDNG